MAGSKSDSHETAVLNVLRGTAIAGITAPHIALFTAAPSEAGPGTEVTGNAYARAPVTFAAPTGTGAGGTSMTNSAVVTFPTPTPAGWGTVVGWGIMSQLAATGSTMLYYSDQTPNKTINAGILSNLTQAQLFYRRISPLFTTVT